MRPGFGRLARAVAGAAIGVVGGVVITLAAVVVRARFQHDYLESFDDLVHWQSAPMLLAPGAGIMFGLAGVDAVKGSVVGSVAGTLIGAVLGAGVGWLLAEYQEGPWAGGVIGAGIGLSVGGLFLGFRGWSRDRHAELRFPSMLGFLFRSPPR